MAIAACIKVSRILVALAIEPLTVEHSTRTAPRVGLTDHAGISPTDHQTRAHKLGHVAVVMGRGLCAVACVRTTSRVER